MTIYAAVDENDTVVVQLGLPDTDGAVAEPPPDGPYAYHVIPAVITGGPANNILKWNGGSPAWVDPRDLSTARAAKNAEINAARLAANRTSFPYGGKIIACDELSRSDIDGVNGIVSLTGAMPPGWLGAWKATDNTYVPIPDRATWVAFYAAMVQAGTDNFNHAQSLKSTLAAATTNSQVDAITWG